MVSQAPAQESGFYISMQANRINKHHQICNESGITFEEEHISSNYAVSAVYLCILIAN